MPRGKFVNHKGRSRHFSSPEELRNQNKEIAKEQEESTSEEEEDDDTVAGTSSKTKSKLNDGKNLDDEDDSETGSDEESSEGEERDARKGVSHLIKIENPNRVVKKDTNKVSSALVDDAEKPELSRSDRRKYEKQKARARYEKLHAAGKTRQAKSDLARLGLIRQQREEAAAKREAERVAAEERKAKG